MAEGNGSFVNRKLRQLGSVQREQGLFGVLNSVGRSLVTSICDCRVQEVRGRIIKDRDPPLSPREREAKMAIECVIVEPGGSLESFAPEFSFRFRDSLDSLKERLDQGCVLILARSAKENNTGNRIVGYTIMERGGFSAAGIKKKISPDILFVHYAEVAEQYRGQRIAQVLTRARNDYCRKNGITKVCNAHTPGNTSSERAFRKFGSRCLCYAVRVSLFRGLIIWHTPWRKIERALDKLETASNG